MTVYVLLSSIAYEGDSYRGVFPSLESAQKASADSGSEPDEWWIHEELVGVRGPSVRIWTRRDSGQEWRLHRGQAPEAPKESSDG